MADSPTFADARRGRFLHTLALAVFAIDATLYYVLRAKLGMGIEMQYFVRAGFAGIVACALVLTERLHAREMGLAVDNLRSDSIWTVKACAVLTVAAFALVALAVVVVRVVKPSLASWPLESRIPRMWLNALVLAPLVEEFIYRGLITPGLVAGYGNRGATAAGAVIWWALHAVYGQPWWMAHYFLAGAILTWAYVARRKLWICVLLHFLGNVFVVLDDALLAWAPGVFEAIVGGRP